MSRSSPPQPDTQHDWDPVFIHSRREAAVIFLIWLLAFAWVVPYSYLNGYGEPAEGETVPLIWGIPSWLFFGVVVPWLVADILTLWFCFGFMKDDDLEPVAEESQKEQP